MVAGFVLVFAALATVSCGPKAGTGGGQDGGNGGGDASTDDGGADAGDNCTGGTLCGQPATCCPAGNECVDNRCLTECASGVRCGATQETCCAAGDVCLSSQCTVPGAGCQDAYDCQQPGEFCEPTLNQCLPQPDPLLCESVPIFGQLTVTPEWEFTDDQIISIPVVADINGDSIPDVVLNLTQTDSAAWPVGNIAVLHGNSGTEWMRIPHNPPTQYGSHGRSTVAVGDVDGDGLPDIIYATREVGSPAQSLVAAVNYQGTLLWISHDTSNNPYYLTINNGAPSLANFDSDPEAEIVFGAALIDNDGLVVWDEGGGGAGPTYGSNANYTGGISAIADLNGDGYPEIVSGRDAWRVDWVDGATPADPPSVTVTRHWPLANQFANDGYPAVADFDGDGLPEVVLVASTSVVILGGNDGLPWCGPPCQNNGQQPTQPVLLPGGATSNRGGPPTVADFDGDGAPEIGVAGGYEYVVYDLDANGQLYELWSRATQDLSSNATGSSVFDFQGDGAAEVVYADECFTRVYSGIDGTVQLEVPSSSATIHEYPLVVDVDGDGNSEILIVTNHVGSCPHASRQGLIVYGDTNDEWVPTRRVWTQHAYHVTNATSAGNVPASETDNWTAAGLNNYRQNVQGDGVFNAPDLAIDLSVGLSRCVAGDIDLRARVTNLGALGVPAGVAVSFYQEVPPSRNYLGTGQTTVPLLPGASTVVSFTVTAPVPPATADYYVAVDDDGGSTNAIDECDETNNGASVTEVSCLVVN